MKKNSKFIISLFSSTLSTIILVIPYMLLLAFVVFKPNPHDRSEFAGLPEVTMAAFLSPILAYITGILISIFINKKESKKNRILNLVGNICMPFLLVALFIFVKRLSDEIARDNFRRHIEIVSVKEPYGIDKNHNGTLDTLIVDVTVKNTDISSKPIYIDLKLRDTFTSKENTLTTMYATWDHHEEERIPGRTMDTIRFELERLDYSMSPSRKASPQQKLIIGLSNTPGWDHAIKEVRTYDINIQDFELNQSPIILENKRIERKSIEGK